MIQLFLALIPEMQTSESLLMFALVCAAIALLTFVLSQGVAAQNASYRSCRDVDVPLLGRFCSLRGVRS